MFVILADQVYGDQEMHSIVRKHCMDYMVREIKSDSRDTYSGYQ